MFSEKFIREIPKTDLHLHLDGSLRLTTLIDLAKRDKVQLPSYTQSGLRSLVFKESYKDLGDYLHGFMYTCEILRKLENLEQCAYELAVDNQNEGVRYIEVRFAPQLFIDNQDLTMEKIFQAINDGLKKAETEFNQRKPVLDGKEPPFHYGIIACAMRMFGPSFSPYYGRFYNVHRYSSDIDIIKLGALELAKAVVRIRDEMGIPIVGFDLAGQEHGYPAEYFKEAYSFVHKNFMNKTVHAGEAYGAESIFQAITELNAERIGHGFYLFDTKKISDPEITNKQKYIDGLASYIADSRTTIEVCLTSNLQTNPALKDIKEHAFAKMLEKRISTTICTDNRLISNTTVTDEVKLAVRNFDISPRKLRNIIVYGFKRSFFPGSYVDKRNYTRQVMDYYETIAKKYKIKE